MIYLDISIGANKKTSKDKKYKYSWAKNNHFAKPQTLFLLQPIWINGTNFELFNEKITSVYLNLYWLNGLSWFDYFGNIIN